MLMNSGLPRSKVSGHEADRIEGPTPIHQGHFSLSLSLSLSLLFALSFFLIMHV